MVQDLRLSISCIEAIVMRIRSLLVITAITLVCWQIVLPTVNTLRLPLNETYGIVSHAVEMGRNPSTNIVIYLLLLLLPCILVVGWIKLREFFRSNSHQLVKAIPSNHLAKRTNLIVIVPILIIVWILNATVIDPKAITSFTNDGFHFGEKIGLTTAYLQSPKLFFTKDYIFIHGFGLNVIPGAIGRWLGGYDFNIAFTVYVVYLQSFLAIAFSFLILNEVAIFLAPRHRWEVLLILSLIYFSLHGILFAFIDRDMMFVIQAYIMLRWLRLSQFPESQYGQPSKPFMRSLLLPFLGAFSIPLSFLYVYDRAVYFVALFICCLIYGLLTTSRQQFFKIFTVSAIGFLSAVTLVSLSFGWQVLPNAIAQVRYWSKVSGLFTGLPYPTITISIGSLINWVPILLQSLTLTLICVQFREECLISGKENRLFLMENYLPIFLLLCAIFYMRVALGRSDGGHLISPGFFAIFAFVACSTHFITKRQLLRISWQSLILATIIATSLVNMNSVFAAVNLKQVSTYPTKVHTLLNSKNSQLLAEDQLVTSRRIVRQVKPDSCFYTLTSEGLWYELFRKPPCSKYWYLIYATTPETQQHVIEDLQQTKPNIILYSGGFGDVLDAIPKESSHLKVHQYIWQHYRPGRIIKNRWFWVRRANVTPLPGLLIAQPNSATGSFDVVSVPDKGSNLFSAAGWAIAPNVQPQSDGKKNVQKNAILLTANPVDQPEKIFPINVGRISHDRPDVATHLGRSDALRSGWTIQTNQLSLPNGNFELKAWVYSPVDDKFYQIPQTHRFSVKHKVTR
jgi:hypothetical protein